MRLRAVGRGVLSVVALGFGCATTSAQSNFEVLHQLTEPEYPPVGKLLEAASGRIYGVARSAGPLGKGAILAYDRTPQGVAATVIHRFSGPDGATPMAGLIQGSDGALYGTTRDGGAENLGTVYRLTPDGTFSVLHSFTAATGGQPQAELVEVAGALYGPTPTFTFRITPTGVFSVLRDPASNSSVGSVHRLLDGHDGKLYGIVKATPVNGWDFWTHGAVFSIALDGTVTVIHDFPSTPFPPGPGRPISLVDGGDGFFYGTTAGTPNFMDAFSPATVFRVSRTGAFTVLFTGVDGLHGDRENLIRGRDGNFYGTTPTDGTGYRGTLFRMTPAGVVTPLYSFLYPSGDVPNSLVQLRDGSLLGSTAEGGLSRRGTIFRSTTGGASQPVHMFGGTDPLTPYAGMIAGPDGALYGSSCFGGTFNAGTLFKLTSAGTVLTVLHSFAYWDGMCPTGSLAFGADGALYGSAALHGLGGGGTIFRLPPTGPLSVLRFFALEDFANGWNPTGVVLASDGNLYGTTRGSFLRWGGTAFRLSAAGLTTLHTFLPGTFNAPTETSPASLFQASDGHLYGATMQGPFRMTLAGEVTPLGDLGVMTRAFTQGTDGALYSATAGYRTDGGTLFRMTLDGSINVLHSHTDGSQRYFSGLLPAPDGTFYGGIAGRERGDPSSLFQLLGAGAPITIHTFSGPDGAHPAAPLTLGPDGAIYGTTVYGGASDRGVIFRFRR